MTRPRITTLRYRRVTTLDYVAYFIHRWRMWGFWYAWIARRQIP